MWLAPEGSLPVAIHFRLEKDSSLFNQVSLLPHIGSLAFVDGIQSLSGYEVRIRTCIVALVRSEFIAFCTALPQKLGIKLKWPNDIYWKTYKLGGAMSKASQNGVDFIIGKFMRQLASVIKIISFMQD